MTHLAATLRDMNGAPMYSESRAEVEDSRATSQHEVDRIAGAVRQLDEILSKLTDRLTDVLVPSASSPPAVRREEEPDTSPLRARLAIIGDDLDNVSRGAAALIARVDL